MTRAIVATVLLLISTMLGAQTLPFPQNADYPYGIMPIDRSHVDAQAAYDHWKSHFVTADGAGGFRRVFYDDPWKPTESRWTVSEGVAYGMLLAVNLADRALFDDLWRYAKLHQNSHDLMHWKVRADGTPDATDSASDADEDMAFALLCADRQWGSGGAINYRQEAITLIGRIFQYEVDPVTFVLKPGDAWGSRPTVNPSYFVPAYYRIFSQVTGDSRWLSVASKSYEILQAAAHSVTGLVPDLCLPDGEPDTVEPERYIYHYDAARAPWRLALDYVWFGVEEARILTEDLTAFAGGEGVDEIWDKYRLNGEPLSEVHNSAFVGPFAAGSMASANQTFCNEAYQETVQLVDDFYYNSSLRALTLLLLTGNFLCPTCETPPPPPAAPSWLRTTAASASQIDLQWDDNSNNEAGFKIERKQGCCGAWTQVATVGVERETWSDTGLQCGTSYAYRVWAYNGAGDSGKTNEAAATTSACTPGSVPACPTWLRTTPVSPSQINLQWEDNSTNEDGFKIERKQGCCGSWTQVTTTGPNVKTWSNTGLACGTTYAYRVWAFNAAGDSCKTNEAGTTTSACP